MSMQWSYVSSGTSKKGEDLNPCLLMLENMKAIVKKGGPKALPYRWF